MKIVKEHINEKFVEDSDPIKDMGIGGVEKILPTVFKQIITQTNSYYIKEIEVDKDEDGDSVYLHVFSYNRLNWRSIIEHIIDLFKKNGIYKYFSDMRTELYRNGSYDTTRDGRLTGWAVFQIYFNDDVDTSKIRNSFSITNENKQIFEKFTEDSDPIKDMGIGVFSPRTFKTNNEYYEWLYKNAKHIIGMELKDGLGMKGQYIFNPDVFHKLLNFTMEYITIPRNFWPEDLRQLVYEKEKQKNK